MTAKGIQIQNQSDDNEFAQAVDSAWKEFSLSRESSLSQQTLNMITLQRQAVTSFLSDGEVFIRKHITRDGFRFELIDPPRIPYSAHKEGQHVTTIGNGILVSEDTGRILAYRIYDKAMDNYRLGATVNENHGKLVAVR